MSEVLSVHTSQAGSEEALLRDSVVAHLDADDLDRSIQFARLLLQARPGLRTLRFLRRVAEGAHAQTRLHTFRVALLSSFSIEFVHDALVAHGFLNGIGVKLYNAGFGAFRQEVLDPASGLYRTDPNLAILAVEGEDWLPAIYSGFSPSAPDIASRAAAAFSEELAGLLRQFRASSTAPLLVHNFAPPNVPQLGILDISQKGGQSRLVNRLNDTLCDLCSQVPDVHLLDYAGLVTRHGSCNWYDARMRLYARAPIAQSMLGELAREYIKYCRALVGLSRKCLVLDLDNTLWGGLIGEDGIDGIQLGPNYPGSAFVEFQRGIRALRDRGVLLAVASKNNAQDVDEVFEKHPCMLLTRADFADVQVHWEPKSDSLVRIARKLNIGLDQLVFADDSAAECERVRSALPMVTVVQLPSQPEHHLETLFENGWFDTLSLSEEDKKRTALYQQRAEAEVLRAATGSVESFYRDLEMVLTFTPLNPKTLSRAAQMTQKTNQFNATTRRYSDAELARKMDDPDWMLFTVAVTDRFGDNGVVGLVIARIANRSVDIDSFLLSCRIIERTVETAMLAHLCDMARERGATLLHGMIIPTAKNTPVRDLFERHGFSRQTEDPTTGSVWRLDLDKQTIPLPTWFEVVQGPVDEHR